MRIAVSPDPREFLGPPWAGWVNREGYAVLAAVTRDSAWDVAPPDEADVVYAPVVHSADLWPCDLWPRTIVRAVDAGVCGALARGHGPAGIVAHSPWLASEIRHLTSIPVRFVPHPAAEPPWDGPLHDGEPFVLAVGRVAPRSRVELLAEGAAQAGLPLRLAGGPGYAVTYGADAARECADEYTARFADLTLGWQLPWMLHVLLLHAAVVVTAREDATAWLPGAEALLHGTPAVAVHNPVIESVYGGALAYCADTPEALAEAIAEAREVPRKECLRRGLLLDHSAHRVGTEILRFAREVCP